MKKQFLICKHNLELRSVIMTDETIRAFDCVSPQKTQIVFPLNYSIEDNDIVIIRDHATKQVEFLGIIDTVKRDKEQTVLIYPFENLFDNECVLQDLDGDICDWIEDAINANFVDTGDDLNDFPIRVVKEYEGDANNDINYKRIIESKNLHDNLTDIFINTGVYLKFDIAFDEFGSPDEIIARVYSANEQDTVNIRFDNPIIIDSKVSIESSHAKSYNKAIVNVHQIINEGEDDEEDRIIYTTKIFLRDDNKLTTDPGDDARIKQVKTKIIDYTPSKDEITAAQYGEAIVVLAEKALCGNAFDHSIEFTVVLNDGYKFDLHRRCDFLAEDRIYSTYVTRVEYMSDRHAKVRLGAYRYAITDRFKALRKGEPSLDSIGNVAVSGLFEQQMFWFSKNEYGDLILNYPDGMAMPTFELDTSTYDLYYVTDDPMAYDGRYVIDEQGDLGYNVK